MTSDAMFSLANVLALPGWAILILGPRRWPLLNAVPSLLIPLVLSALYTGLVLAHFSGAGSGYGTLAAIRQLFASDPVLVAGWAHYLAFDMMIGAMLATRMDRAGVQRLVQAPVLIVTFMFGPVGVLLTLLTEGAVRLTTPISGAVRLTTPISGAVRLTTPISGAVRLTTPISDAVRLTTPTSGVSSSFPAKGFDR